MAWNHFNSGGTTTGTTLDGTQFIDNGTTTGTTIDASGYQAIQSGGSAVSTTVSGGGSEYIYSGGTAIGTTVSSGGLESINSGGTTTGTTLDGTQFIYNGTTTGTTIDAFGYQAIQSGSTAVSTTVSSGGLEYIFSGSTAISTTVSSGGQEYVDIGATATGTTVSSGGKEIIITGATATGTTVSNGGNQFVYSGGTAVSTTVSGGGHEIVYSSGTANFTTISNGGTEVVIAGGVASFTTVSLGGSAVISAGGVASFTTISLGGSAVISSGGQADSTTVSFGGQEIVSFGGIASFTTVSGGYEVVAFGGIASGATLKTGGLETISSGGSAVGTTVSSGSFESVEYGGSAVSTTVSSGGFEVISAGGFASATTLLPGGGIDVISLSYTSGGSASVNASDVLTVSVGGHTYSQQLVGNYTGTGFTLTPVSGGGTQVTESALCFCRDTLIATPSGEVKVQDLAVGDLVTTRNGQAQPIVWIGAGAVLATRGQRSAATPVIVCKGALADNVPRLDLRVTKGHSFYIDDVLIPVEFLVNHRSILWDDRAQEVQLYHIELATHDVLIANGAPAESYRDDGNRWLFRNANTGWDQPAKPPCAPVLTGGKVVDAAWRRLLDRAGPRPGLPLTDDPDLHLLVDGQRVDAINRHDDEYMFRLPRRPHSVRLCSHAAVPQELGLARDARPLGVAVRRIALARPGRQRTIAADAPSLRDGFHAFEAALGIRWTDGDATVPAALFADLDGPAMLVVQLGGTTRYVDTGSRMRAA